MEVPIAQDATTQGAHASLDHVRAPAALVAVSGHLRASKYFISRHMPCKMPASATIGKGEVYIAT